MFTVVATGTFDAAHHLPGYNGPCANVHGHTWKVRVAFQSNQLDGLGMAIDLVVLKGALRGILKELDHHNLNDQFEQPTAEKLAAIILGRMPFALAWVEVEETPGCYVRFDGKYG